MKSVKRTVGACGLSLALCLGAAPVASAVENDSVAMTAQQEKDYYAKRVGLTSKEEAERCKNETGPENLSLIHMCSPYEIGILDVILAWIRSLTAALKATFS